MTLLALDLGTACGFAIFKDGKFISGTKKLGTYKEKFGARFHEFRTWLLNIIAKHNIEAVYFERVFGHKGVEAAHCYGGFLYMLASVCFKQNIPCTGLTVQAIKKFMTGKGNATKDEMIAAARRKGFNPKTDDEADAIAIMLLAIEDQINRDKKTNKSGSGSFRALGESGSRDPTISLASDFFRGLTPNNHSKTADSKKNKISVRRIFK